MAREVTIDGFVYEEITVAELVLQIQATIMGRAGEVITPELALERARNIAAGLSNCIVKG